HLACLDECIDAFGAIEFVPAVNARAEQHLECAAEAVLMDLRRTLEPEVNVDVKTRCDKESDRRIAEVRTRIFLRRQLRLKKRPFDHFPRRKLRRKISPLERVGR